MSAPIATWLPAPLASEVAAALRRLADADDVARIAVMPDVHLAEDVCIGTVVATRTVLYPAAVGGDIGCGVATVRFAADASILDDPRCAARVLDAFTRRVPALRHREARVLATDLSHPALVALARTTGAHELGTLGRGNHFLELQADDQGGLWAMVHTGSRAIGQAIRDHHLRDATGRGGGLRGLDADSVAGRAYLADLAWAVAYAAMNRGAILATVVQILGELFSIAPIENSAIECNHNHVQREDHGGELLWVHRKGAIAAALDQPGLIPGSMGTTSYHVAGRGVTAALASSSHGAGRRFSRTEARRRISAKELSSQLGSVWFDRRRLDALRDEAPSAYKSVDEVMRAQRELTRIGRRVRPRLSYKGT